MNLRQTVTLILAALLVALPCCLTAPADAQIASALIREADTLPGDSMANPISAINNSAVNYVGGYAFTVNTESVDKTFSHIWGDATGLPGTVLQTEGTIGDLEQTSFESFFGIADSGAAAYSALSNQISTGATSLDGVWVDDTVVLNELDSIPGMPGLFSTFNSRPGSLGDGTPVWVGGLTDTAGGGTQVRAQFRGNPATIVIMGGDSVVGVPEPINTAGPSIDFDFRYSENGTSYINQVLLDSTSADDGLIIVNGAAMMAGGSIIREASPVPASVGGLPAENYDNFDFLGITENGDYLITGDTDADTALDEYIMVSGQIVLREGDQVSGLTLAGGMEGAYLNESGDWAAIWDVDLPSGDNVEALLFNGQLALLEGDKVDWNNDGIIDAGDMDAAIDSFTGISSLTVGERDASGNVDIYFAADVNFGGIPDILEGGFRLTQVIPEPASLVLLMPLALFACGLRRGRSGS